MLFNVMVLDDDDQVRESLRDYLEDQELSVHETSSSEEALRALEEVVPDIIIVDLRLPGMDGIKFIMTARSRWPELKFIIYTGSPEFKIPTELATLPDISNVVFLKPLPDLSRMMAEIRRMLEIPAEE